MRMDQTKYEQETMREKTYLFRVFEVKKYAPMTYVYIPTSLFYLFLYPVWYVFWESGF